jgi:hypothetical protein
MNATPRIKLSTSFPNWPVAQQTPAERCHWHGVEFFLNQPVSECDAWFVYDGLPAVDSTCCPEGNLCFITAEPSTFKRYNRSWLKNFDRVITSQQELQHPNKTSGQTGLPWLLRKSYDELSQMSLPAKTAGVSVISSTKTTTRGHRRRLAFVRELMRQAPVEVFGRGFRPLEDKWDGLAPFCFSIAIENSSHPDYWTEKIADCFLAGTVPIYNGCPNIGEYFPKDSFIPIEIDDTTGAIHQIKQIMVNAHASHAAHIPALLEARDLVLNRYNLFNVIAEAYATMNHDRTPRPITLAPEPRLSGMRTRWLKWKRRWLDRD